MHDPVAEDWRLPPPVAAADARALERHVGLPIPLCELLVRRGYVPDDEVRRFLRPGFHDLHRPADLPDLSVAADRIEAAIAAGEGILVHGDYDVDGMTGAAVLATAMRELGGDAVPFVPHRARDGYDLGAAGIARARELGATLIVTVDCGTSAIDAVRDAGAAGLDVIVTDHHKPGPELPPAVAVVNPSRPGHAYPFRPLAGVGVAFKLVQELFERKGFREGHLNRYLDLVALGTIADQAPLIGENRALARFGLRVLDRTRRPGVRALLRQARVGRWSAARASDIAFRIAPRLNSVGRIGDAAVGLDLLMSDDDVIADRLARRIEEANGERRAIDRAVQEGAARRLDTGCDPAGDPAVVLWEDGWHPGVLGIVASRLVDELGRPVVLIGMNGETGRGSARTAGGLHLFRALSRCAQHLDRFGGHAAAAGFDIRRDELEAFRGRFLDEVRAEVGDEPVRPRLEIDQELPVGVVADGLARALSHLEPFGSGNPMPRFIARDVRFRDVEAVGRDGDHLRFRLVDGGGELDGIAFWRGPELGDLLDGRTRDVAYELHVEKGPRGLRAQAHLIGVRDAS